MFDFSNLSDYEFEVLTKDVLERLTNQKLRVFKQGKDGGIDVMNGNVNNLLIAQAKRYTTSFSNLKTSLSKLIAKLEKINPKKLYIVTSLGLTPQNLDEIFKMFSKYISDKNQILGKDDLNQLLEKEEYKDIVAKNFKLWMSASKCLDFISRETH